MLRTFIVMLCFALSASHAWGFGPHGDGRIGDDPNISIIPGGIPIIQNIRLQNFQVPVSYPSLSRRDLVPAGEVIDVEGMSSMRKFTVPLTLLGIATPIASLSADFGDRGVQEAIADAKNRYGVRDLYDVRIDRKRFSLLCIVIFCAYSKITTIVHAKGVVDTGLRSP
ncbi:MAG TPA: hypothetical protein EYO39_00290 [Nitrospirales bacterium]|nr:hypothetical protein [Nitrospirales bacterium]